jgi:hypothetical protein
MGHPVIVNLLVLTGVCDAGNVAVLLLKGFALPP